MIVVELKPHDRFLWELTVLISIAVFFIATLRPSKSKDLKFSCLQKQIRKNTANLNGEIITDGSINLTTTYGSYSKTSSFSSPRPSSPSYGSRSSSGGSVQVKGYARKDGTYVKPHTRSAPRRR